MIDRIAAAENRKRRGEVQRAVRAVPPLTDAQVTRVAALLALGPFAETPEASR
ncbi:hypothetical protein [Curtobacterium flaccumfaciens]|uniref:hypothetical protein n=1 Tax=Curtobacterium flaccumfaciens TaxID=2035 RepID=UPI003EBB4EA2